MANLLIIIETIKYYYKDFFDNAQHMGNEEMGNKGTQHFSSYPRFYFIISWVSQVRPKWNLDYNNGRAGFN